MNGYEITHYESRIAEHEFAKVKGLIESNSSEFIPPLLSRRIFPTHLDLIQSQGGAFAALTDSVPLAVVTYIEGYSTGSSFYDGSPYIPYIVTNPDNRRKGCMRATLQEAIEFFRGQRYERLILESWSTNTASLTLFGSLGFVEVSRTRNGRQIGVDDVKLELLLQKISLRETKNTNLSA